MNYFLSGYKAILLYDEDIARKVKKPRGLKLFIDSVVPVAAGVSSSAAFCVSAAIATMRANDLEIEKGKLS